jgi:DNA polymerase (family 10)
MAFNTAAAEQLADLAKLLELTGADKFRVLAHQKAARVVEATTTDLLPIAQDAKALTAIEGIGPRMADKIGELARTGKMAELEELRATVPAGLMRVMEVPGLGPKTVRMLWQEANVTDLAGLRRVIEDGSILNLPRMGEKAVEKIKAALTMLAESAGRLPLGLAMPVAERVAEAMRCVPGVSRAQFAGSLRRGKETIGDLDVLVATTDPAAAAEAFCTLPGVRQTIVRGETKCSVRMSVGADLGRWAALAGDAAKDGAAESASADASAGEAPGSTIQVDLKVVPDASWGAALMYFTGSKEHNVKLRERAQRMGMTLNEYGLFKDDGGGPRPQERASRPLAGRTEEEVFGALGLAFAEPELREDRGEVAEKGAALPRLIRVEDCKAELHAHTTASDGTMTIAQLAALFAGRGFHTLAVTDHSQSSAIAGGLKPAALRAHVKAVKAAAKDAPLTLLTGSEVDILADGRLDYTDDLLAELDVVVASPHAGLSQDSATATERLVRAVSHPLVHVLGHPTGRLIQRRRGLEPDMNAVFKAAAANKVALEINAHWMRLDLRDTHVKAALEAGCLISINCDTHAPEDAENLRYGVLTGRRGWLTPERCVNCWPPEKLRAWLKAKGRAG